MITHRPPVESECRREDFRADVAIVLSDGQVWHVPRPRMTGTYLAPVAGDADGSIPMGISEFGPEYDFRVEETVINYLNNRMDNRDIDWLARTLLRANYRLEDRDFYWLLRFLPDDTTNQKMWIDLTCVSCGMLATGPSDPKARSAAGPNTSNGSESDSSLAASIPVD